MDYTPDATRDIPRVVSVTEDRAETPAEIERDIALTRERVSGALVELERKVDPRQMIMEHPLVAITAAFAVGVVLGTRGGGKNSAAAPHVGGASKGVLRVIADHVATTVASAATARLLHGSSGDAPRS